MCRLIYVLGKYGESDWRLANLICQALWNFCIDSTHLYAAFGIPPTNQLLTILIDLLGNNKIATFILLLLISNIFIFCSILQTLKHTYTYTSSSKCT